MNITKEDLQQIIKEELEAVLYEKCQKGYKTHEKRKTKKMFGKTYRNCVKAEESMEMEEDIDEAKSYHWDEPDWFYGGGYGDGTLEEKKNQQKGKKRAAKVAKRKKTKKQASSEKNLGDWFDRQGEKGSKGGWVDCKAPDGDGGYSECAQGKRKKKPYCRPTPSACKSEPQKKE